MVSEEPANGVQRSLGKLEGSLTQVQATLEVMSRDARDRDARADESRERLSGEIASMNMRIQERLSGLDARLSIQEALGITHQNQLSIALPMVEEWRTVREQGRGALKLGRVLYLLLATVVAGLGTLIAIVWHYLEKLPPHPGA